MADSQRTQKDWKLVPPSLWGGFFILLGLLDIAISGRILPALPSGIAYYFRYLAILEWPWGVVWGILYVAGGAGLIAGKSWARQLVGIMFLTSVFLSFKRVWMWDSPGSIFAFSLQALLGALLLWGFALAGSNPETESPAPRLKPFRLLHIYFMVLALASLALMLGFKIAFHKDEHCGTKEPWFRPKAVATVLTPLKPESGKYRTREILDTSLMLPRDFIIQSIFKSKDEPSFWQALLADPRRPEQGTIILTTLSDYEFNYRLLLEKFDCLGFSGAQDFERSFLTNDWSPIYMGIREELPEFGTTTKVENFYANNLSGYIKTISNGQRMRWEVSFYSPDHKHSRNLTFENKVACFNPAEIAGILASVRLQPFSAGQAERCFRDCLTLLQAGQPVEAQYQIAKAYYLSRLNPEYAYTLANLMYPQSLKGCNSAMGILRLTLKANPEHLKARQLLDYLRRTYDFGEEEQIFSPVQTR